jgi:hypothetical protein
MMSPGYKDVHAAGLSRERIPDKSDTLPGLRMGIGPLFRPASPEAHSYLSFRHIMAKMMKVVFLNHKIVTVGAAD